jgi:tetratricopeptide (TPR) repeat protein
MDGPYLARATLAWFRLQGRTADEEMAKAAEHAQRAGDRGLLAVARRERALMAVGAADRAAIREQAKALERADLGPAGVSARKYLEAFVARLEGRLGEARALVAESAEMERGLGLHIEAAGKAQLAADIELAADKPGEAVRVLRSSCQELERLGERAYFATAAAMLSQALVHAGDVREAERVAHEARAASADNDLVNVIVTDRVLAQIHGQRREHSAAERLARHAAALALDSDWELLIADTLLTLGRVLHAAGKHDEARDAINDAIRHYERKGDVVGTRQARGLAGELLDTARP